MNGECFASRDGGCAVLLVYTCAGAKCSFFKTQEQFIAGKRAAMKRIASLPPETRAYIAESYYKGKRPPWGE